MSLCKSLSAFAFAASVCSGPYLIAQNPQPVRPQDQVQVQIGQPQPAARQTGAQVNDHSIATCTAIGNQEEIALAKFAQSRTDNDDVQSFAKKVIQDHQEFLKKLERFAPDAVRENSLAEGDQPAANEGGVRTAGGAAVPVRPGRAIQQTAAAEPRGTRAGASIDFVQLHREIAAQCLSDSKKMLGEKEGAEFDACFVGQQIGVHAAMQSKLTVLQRHATSELAQVLGEGIEVAQNHRKQAESLMKQLPDPEATTKQVKND